MQISTTAEGLEMMFKYQEEILDILRDGITNILSFYSSVSVFHCVWRLFLIGMLIVFILMSSRKLELEKESSKLTEIHSLPTHWMTEYLNSKLIIPKILIEYSRIIGCKIEVELGKWSKSQVFGVWVSVFVFVCYNYSESCIDEFIPG